jgi:hypothetical protein
VLPAGRATIRTDHEKAVAHVEFFMTTPHGRDAFETVRELGDLGEWSYASPLVRRAAVEISPLTFDTMQLMTTVGNTLAEQKGSDPRIRRMGERECFTIMPITTTTHYVELTGDPDHFSHVMNHLHKPAIERAGYRFISPSVTNAAIIQAQIIRHLESAELVLCDISCLNANVFFELGIRVALDRPVALVRDSLTADVPFDNAMMSCHTYDA